MKQKALILYHKNCPDGFGAAWAAWRTFGANGRYIAINHAYPPPVSTQNADVYLVDICYGAANMHKLKKSARRVTVLDHHVSRRDAVRISDAHVYDSKRSGASIAWNYFHPSKKIPLLLRYVEDSDLWRFRLPSTREIIAALDTEKFDFKIWSAFSRALEQVEGRRAIVAKGGTIRAYQQTLVERICKNAEEALFRGRRARVVNSPVFNSEIGQALLGKGISLGIVWSFKEGDIRVSLRSRGAINVAKIAERLGGGGHVHAAGFSFKRGKKFPWKTLKK